MFLVMIFLLAVLIIGVVTTIVALVSVYNKKKNKPSLLDQEWFTDIIDFFLFNDAGSFILAAVITFIALIITMLIIT